MSNNPTIRETYCPTCDEQTDARKTVPWQEDVCTECANPIPEDI